MRRLLGPTVLALLLAGLLPSPADAQLFRSRARPAAPVYSPPSYPTEGVPGYPPPVMTAPAPAYAPTYPPAVVTTPTPQPLLPIPVPVPAPVPVVATPTSTGTGAANLKVFYRLRGEAEWRPYGLYLAEPGGRVANHLAKQGYEVYSQRTGEPIPRVPPRPPEVNLPETQTVTLAQAEAGFRVLAARDDIAFRYPSDGCYARTHLMVRHLAHLGYTPFKAWAFSNGHDMAVKTGNHPSGEVVWEYHVAPALRVRDHLGGQHWYVLDPALFSQVVPLARWEAAMARSPYGYRPYLRITRPGEPVSRPLESSGKGTGYWPASDPAEGLDEHAISTMRKFKPHEGKEPPRSFSGAASAWSWADRDRG